MWACMMSTVTAEHPEILLGSASPRRAALLTRAGFSPIVRPADIPEVRAPHESPAAYTRRLVREKAAAVLAACRAAGDEALPVWLLCADTTVARGDELLEKPADAEDACRMLARLSAATHEVHTSYGWFHRHDPTRAHVATVTTFVTFRKLSDETIRRYVATGEPMDKAGAYGIQGVAEVFVEEVRGSYSGVVGLPLCEVIATLDELGGLGPYPF